MKTQAKEIPVPDLFVPIPVGPGLTTEDTEGTEENKGNGFLVGDALAVAVLSAL
jgi:hypothetical protein